MQAIRAAQPKKGWKERLMRGEDPNQGEALRRRQPVEVIEPTRVELLATIAEQEAEIDRLRLKLEEATLRAAWHDRID